MGERAFQSIRLAVQSSLDEGIHWKNEGSNRSFALLLQIYSDKSNTTMKSSAFTLYPVHVAVVNFNENMWRHMIVHGWIILGYLPCTFFPFAEHMPSDVFPCGISREVRINMLHKCMESLFADLNDVFYLASKSKQAMDLN